MLGVANNLLMLGVVRLNVVMLSVVILSVVASGSLYLDNNSIESFSLSLKAKKLECLSPPSLSVQGQVYTHKTFWSRFTNDFLSRPFQQ